VKLAALIVMQRAGTTREARFGAAQPAVSEQISAAMTSVDPAAFRRKQLGRQSSGSRLLPLVDIPAAIAIG